MLTVLLSAAWIVSSSWNAWFIAVVIVIYLMVRHIYYIGYIEDPKKALLGSGPTILPIFFLRGSALVDAIWSLI